MSLDVSLLLDRDPEESLPPTERIFVRREEATVGVSREEWDALYPGREPVAVVASLDSREVFTANITHNLGKMAAACGLYKPLWRPEETGIERAEQLIEPLRKGLTLLRFDRPRFERYNPPNGWGDYDDLAIFTEDYLAACETWPDAAVRASR